jgi:hypothetical protein
VPFLVSRSGESLSLPVRRRVEFRADVCQRFAARLLVLVEAMLALFLADPEIVYWDLRPLGPNHIGPYRLVIQHASGCVTEYFDSLTRALRRMGELEDLLREAHAANEIEDYDDPIADGRVLDACFGGADKLPS